MNNKILLILLLIIVVQSAIIIFRKPNNNNTEINDQYLKDSIAVLQSKLDQSFARELILVKENDSLESIEQQVIYRTNEKIKFIFSTTDPNILDSIIRHGWRTH